MLLQAYHCAIRFGDNRLTKQSDTRLSVTLTRVLSRRRVSCMITTVLLLAFTMVKIGALAPANL